MNKMIFIFLLTLLLSETQAQNDIRVKKIVSMSNKDTIEIKRFDNNGNLILQKIFPQYGISQILVYSYSGNRLVSYTWSHSNIGFVETEYEYDTLQNRINIYSIELNENMPLARLMSYYSVESLKTSKEFKKFLNNGRRYLKFIQYLEDSLIVREEEFDNSGNLKKRIYYSYENRKLASKKEVNENTKSYNELIYKYDSLGNELLWMKVYNSKDTSVVVKSSYKENILLEQISIESGKLHSKEYFTYNKGRLETEKQYNSSGELKISSIYNYYDDGRIDFIDNVNYYMGQKKRIKYYY